MNVRIIVDSTADLTEDIKKKFTVVPLTIHFGNEEYVDGITITHREFYEKLIESDVLPSTSQASPAAFSEVFEDIVNSGDCALVITISSKLSGTYQSAVIAAADYPERVYVIDSKSAAIGTGILAKYALELKEKGMPLKELYDEIEREKENICVIAMLDTLEYLKKGGRISKTAALAGSLLSIKPVITLADGEITVLGKARGSKQANNFLMAEIQKHGVDFTKPVMLGYTGLSDILLKKYIEDSEIIWKDNADKLCIAEVGSVIGTHAGPGAIAAAFFKNNN